MRKPTFNRRDVLKGATALAAGTRVRSTGSRRAAAGGGDHAGADRGGEEGRQARLLHGDGPAVRRTPRQVVRSEIPGIAVRVERSGAERVFQRIGQEYASNIHAVDVVNTADQAHVIVWKRNGWLAPYLPEDVAKYYDKKYYDPEGFDAGDARAGLAVRLNTNLVKMEDAPKSFADLLDPKWTGKMVKAHPGL